jgi:hypothetical protein
MKKYIVSLLMALSFVASSHALTLTYSPAAGNVTNNVLGTQAVVITSISLSGVSGTPLFRLFDSANSSITVTNQGFTNNVYLSTTCSNYFTNYLGVLETNTYPCVTNQLVYSPPTNFLAPIITTVVGVTNTTVTVGSSSLPFIALQGITITNANAGTMVITYYPFK